MDRPARIGILGGAGPMAGAALFERIVTVLQRDYGCREDADFPRILLLSEPFAQMLQPGNQDESMVTQQLHGALESLIAAGAELLAIACNTLHGFLEGERIPPQLVHLTAETEKYLHRCRFTGVLMLATTTSREKQLYPLPAVFWPDQEIQRQVDALIAEVLSGQSGRQQREALEAILCAVRGHRGAVDAVVLGCTELSLLTQSTELLGLPVVDPLTIAAERLCSEMYKNK